jgi:hypothetical protein
MPLELHVYDFDNTLFRSPLKPQGWETSWWADDESLNPPCVPHHPGDEWWVPSTVAQAKKSIQDPNVWAVVLTGRSESSGSFRYRVPELLRQKGLSFDQVFLKVGGGSTEAYKIKVLLGLLRKHPGIEIVHIYEDRAPHLLTFSDFIGRLGLTCYPHLVRAKPVEPMCSRVAMSYVDRKPEHVSVFVENPKHLTNWWLQNIGPLLDKSYAHHMTITFKPEDVWSFPLGSKVNLKVTGYAQDDKAQVVVVSGFHSENEIPHITISTRKDITPVYSNSLLKQGYHTINGPVISGKVGVSVKGMPFVSPIEAY